LTLRIATPPTPLALYSIIPARVGGARSIALHFAVLSPLSSQLSSLPLGKHSDDPMLPGEAQ